MPVDIRMLPFSAIGDPSSNRGIMVSLVLVEDHRLVLDAMRALLEQHPGFRVAGEASDGPSALTTVERVRPDVLVLDLLIPGLHGLEVIRAVRKRYAQVKIVVLSMFDSEAYVHEAVRDGASAYVLKSAPAVELVRAIETVLKGQRYLSPPLSMERLAAYELRAKASTDPYDRLTVREREVLRLVAHGRSSPAIAEELAISRRTVETHRANLMQKLGIKRHADLVRLAIQRGLLPPDR